MIYPARTRMTVDEFLIWGEGQPKRYELHDGELYAMSPQTSAHALTKFAVQAALTEGIRKASLPCTVYPDGMTVRINARTAYEPDALVYCGPKLPPDVLEVPSPVIVVEVVSPSTKKFDATTKVDGYFSLPSVFHYLIVDPAGPPITHHRRSADGKIEKRPVQNGIISFDPPAFAIETGAIFG